MADKGGQRWRLPLQGVHMGSPTSSNTSQLLDILFWWWISLLVDAISGHTVHELELDVRNRCGERHGIATVGAKGKVEDEDLLELWSCQGPALTTWFSEAVDLNCVEGMRYSGLNCPYRNQQRAVREITYSQCRVQDVFQTFIFQIFKRILWYQDYMSPNIEPRP
jgi:hypothetical protein